MNGSGARNAIALKTEAVFPRRAQQRKRARASAISKLPACYIREFLQKSLLPGSLSASLAETERGVGCLETAPSMQRAPRSTRMTC